MLRLDGLVWVLVAYTESAAMQSSWWCPYHIACREQPSPPASVPVCVTTALEVPNVHAMLVNHYATMSSLAAV